MACLQSTFTPIGGTTAAFRQIGEAAVAFRKTGGMTAIISPICGVDLWLYERLLDANHDPLLTVDSQFILVHKQRED